MEDSYNELLLLVHSKEELIKRIVDELCLCYDNQFRETKLYTDEETFFLHRLLLFELKKEQTAKSKEIRQ